jgi:hypothetical protein
MNLAKSALLLPVLAVACAGPGAKAPGPGDDALTKSLAAAFDEEAKGSPEAALRMYLDVVEEASVRDGSPWQVVTLEAALDALVLRSVPALADVTMDTALAFRAEKSGPAASSAESPDAPKGTIAARLAAIYAKAGGPFARGLLARAMLDLAEHGGDPIGAARWRARTGCALEATVIGPLNWAPVTGIRDVDPLEAYDARIAPAYSTVGAFAHAQAPVVARGRGCSIDLAAPSATTGVRDVVLDVPIARAGFIGVALRSRGAATLRAGGKIVIDRPYELGGDEVPRFARITTTPGKLRLVARVGVDEDGETLEIDAWDEQGAPLSMQAPRANEAGNVHVVSAEALLSPSPKTDAERVTVAAGSLASGDGRTAERLLERLGATAPPDMRLLYARAVETANDLSSVNRSERARAAYEKVLDAWPGAWEAILAHAVLAGVRRGEGDARIETLRDLDQRRAKAGSFALPILDAFDAATSGREHLYDRSHAALDRAKPALENTSLLVDAGRIALERAGTERVAYVCSALPPHDRRGLDCYQALRDAGNLRAAGEELDRLRTLRGGDALLLALSLRDALAVGDAKGAARVLGKMTPGEATLSDLYGTATLGGQATDLYGRLHDALTIARDAPSAWPALLASLEKDPIASFAGIAEALSQADRARPMPEDAATAVLAHTEKYDVDASGVVHAILFDVRRVSGTTDVEENAQAEPPDILGRSTLRVLRRRILKRDGRIVEPDPTPRASQGHADLSQLEAGDLVEAIYENWAVPNEAGDIGIDTPDMLPERTAVHDGVMELRLPVGLKASLWTHPLWGKAAQSIEGSQRVLAYRMKDQPVRRIEEGTPRMDRSVALSFGTARWAEVAAGLREALASLDEHDPETAAWAERAVSGLKDKTPQAEIAAVVVAAGVAVKEAAAGVLTDVALGRATGPQTTTARTIVTNREGSRTWLIVRALRELGIRAEVVIAENEPFSESPDFPPHVGRFLHPLAVAHLAPAGAPGDDLVWIDADVPGPPLPAGRISPELRGRSAIHIDGSIVPLPVLSGEEERDEIDLRLVVNPNGDAKGTFTIVLRGREAQEIAEMLLRTVGDERQKALRGVALAWVPFADVDDVVLSSSEESWQIALRADLTIPSYAEVAGAPSSRTWLLPGVEPLHTVFPRGSASTLGATYAGQGKRQSALAVSHAVQYHAHRRVELPPDARIVSLPGPFEVRTARLEASRRLSVSGAVIEDDFVLGVPTGTIPSSDYETFVADVHRTDDAFLAATRVKPARQNPSARGSGVHSP